jgi:hypothetical protein
MDLNDLVKNPEQIKSLIDILQALLPSEDKESNSIDPEQDDRVNFNMKTKSKKRPSSNTNKFDSMHEAKMHKEDTIIDKKLCQAPPTARARQFATVDVVCRVCGTKDSVSPSMVFESPSRYKCNKCSTSAG